MKSTKGFTLIELLVVIAIIGILSSVVLASLNSARNKGADAAVKSGLANMRAQAELYYDANEQSYVGVCASTTDGIATMVLGAASSSGADVACYDDAMAWSVSAQLKSTSGSWCVGNSGASKAIATPVASSTDCE